MSDTTASFAEQILGNTVDKQDAMRRFEALSDEQRHVLISVLRAKLGKHDSGESELDHSRYSRLLSVVDERSMSDDQQAFIDQLATEMAAFAPRSKQNALEHQRYFVDQRKTSNLKKGLKALQFHITYDRGEGAYLYDVDGNKYVDVTGDNGVNIFGHQPAFIKEAIKSRVDRGFPLVGYTEELFEAARLFTEITGHERVLFTQSGTEAVMWAVRIARAATQKQKIVLFEGSYHGLSDAVLAMKDLEGNSVSMGLGMLQEFADQIIVLDYGDMNGLRVIEDRAEEIAGILVEPVQSRHPYNQPVEFLKEIRKLTLELNIPLILDEMITGFRVCPRGAQGYFDVKADIATYGKVPGGGMPTGMIAGLAKYMNYVDGGTWRFDDDSMPSMKRTLMAGTHTRNPVKIAATVATLREIKQRSEDAGNCKDCTCFQRDLNEKNRHMAEQINDYFIEQRIPAIIDYFSSLFKIRFFKEPNGIGRELFIILLRMRGVETSVSGNFFLTTAHTDEDIQFIVDAVKSVADTLLEKGFFFESDDVEELPVPAAVIPPPVSQLLAAPPLDIDLLKQRLKADLTDLQGGVN